MQSGGCRRSFILMLLVGVRGRLMCHQHVLAPRQPALLPHTLPSVCYVIVSSRFAVAGAALPLQLWRRPLLPRLPPATVAPPLLMPCHRLFCQCVMPSSCVLLLAAGAAPVAVDVAAAAAAEATAAARNVVVAAAAAAVTAAAVAAAAVLASRRLVLAVAPVTRRQQRRQRRQQQRRWQQQQGH